MRQESNGTGKFPGGDKIHHPGFPVSDRCGKKLLPAACSSLDDMNHHISRIRLGAISLLNRLDLVLGDRLWPVSRSR